MTDDSVYMARCLELAKNGGNFVRPNPLVGALLVNNGEVNNGEVLAEGWHACFGGPHAEVDAISKVVDKDRLRNSTLYVSLEPCSHQGKTPPCTDLIISSGIRKVVCAMTDPFARVSGQGIERLRKSRDYRYIRCAS